MPRRLLRISSDRPLLDVVSYGRRGLQRRDRFTLAERELLVCTVARVPEVMVKISGGGRTAQQVAAHLRYISRAGRVHLETDEGERLHGRGTWNDLVREWDLDLEGERASPGQPPPALRKPAKLVHNIVFSMPPGTSPNKLLAAVRDFAREQFALQHRYVMTLHTDEAHPHVHLVVKARSEQGIRLHPNPAMLREWRAEFARHLRERGIAANATDRAVRGRSQASVRDGIYRAMQRGVSTYHRARIEQTAADLANSAVRPDTGRARLLATRHEVVRGWLATAHALARQGDRALAAQVMDFVRQMPPARTDLERIRASIERARGQVLHQRGPVR